MRSASTPKTARRITSSVIRRVCGVQAHRPPERPAGHVARGRLDDHLLVLAHALAVERRQQQLALAHVLGPVSTSTELCAHDRRHR